MPRASRGREPPVAGERPASEGSEGLPCLLMRRLAALLVAVLLVGGCSSGARTPPAAPSTTAPAATTTTVAPQPTDFAVGRRTIDWWTPAGPPTPTRAAGARPARPHPAGATSTPRRVRGDAHHAADDAAPADGTFPLVVFSHGWTASGPVYEGLIQEWARAGYIVAAPTFPLSSGKGGVLKDYVNQPADVSFVIDQLTALPADDALAAHLDAEAIAAAGHSLGAITTLGVTLNSCCADPRIDAAIELSGIRLPFPGALRRPRPGAVPRRARRRRHHRPGDRQRQPLRRGARTRLVPPLPRCRPQRLPGRRPRPGDRRRVAFLDQD